jgi:hypothetical protein
MDRPWIEGVALLAAHDFPKVRIEIHLGLLSSFRSGSGAHLSGSLRRAD